MSKRSDRQAIGLDDIIGIIIVIRTLLSGFSVGLSVIKTSFSARKSFLPLQIILCVIWFFPWDYPRYETEWNCNNTVGRYIISSHDLYSLQYLVLDVLDLLYSTFIIGLYWFCYLFILDNICSIIWGYQSGKVVTFC